MVIGIITLFSMFNLPTESYLGKKYLKHMYLITIVTFLNELQFNVLIIEKI